MALSKDLRNIVKGVEAGDDDGQLFASRQVMDALGALLSWVGSNDTLIQWDGSEGLNGATGSTLAPAAGVLSASVKMKVTSADNVQNPFRQNGKATVTLTGTATGKTINGVAGPLVVELVDGEAEVLLAGTSTGTIIATLSAGLPSQLSATDVLTVTLS
jgi:hypothetical protein